MRPSSPLLGTDAPRAWGPRRLPRPTPRARKPERRGRRGDRRPPDQPVQRADPEAVGSEAGAGGAPRHTGRATAAPRVLIVDDERAIRFLCRINLASTGFEALEAEDGEEALRRAAAERPDLILLDVMMPGLDGWAVARELGRRPETRDIPIVFVTARSDQADRLLGRQLGGVGYLVKPFDPITLPATIEGILRRLERGEREQLNREIASE